MGRRTSIGASAVLVAAAAVGAVLLTGRATRDVAAITAGPDAAAAGTAELQALLASPDFKDQARAQRQLAALPPAERGAILESLAQSPRPEVRLLAISGIAREADRSAFRALLFRLAATDPDPDVRAAASQLQGGPP